MWLLRRLTFGVVVFSPVILISGELAGSELDREPLPVTHFIELAQAVSDQPADDTTADDSAAADEGAEEEPAVFTEEFLSDPAHIEGGEATWANICRGCHGAQAYPGKAPKLRPSRYAPEFVFDRVTNGYKAMPPWKDVLTREERMDLVAYVLSPHFSP
jgi:mono/diheme cytochrome c family protein